jgi:hypothetical protein
VFRRVATGVICAAAIAASSIVGGSTASAAPVVGLGSPCIDESTAALTADGARVYCYYDFRPGAPEGLRWLRSSLPYNNDFANGNAAKVLPPIGQSATNFWPILFFTSEIDLQRWGVASAIAALKPEAWNGYHTALAFTPNAPDFLTGFQSWINVLPMKSTFGGSLRADVAVLNDMFNDEGTRPAGVYGGRTAALYLVLESGLHVVLMVVGNSVLHIEGPNVDRTLNVVNQVLAFNGRPGVNSLTPARG